MQAEDWQAVAEEQATAIAAMTAELHNVQVCWHSVCQTEWIKNNS